MRTVAGKAAHQYPSYVYHADSRDLADYVVTVEEDFTGRFATVVVRILPNLHTVAKAPCVAYKQVVSPELWRNREKFSAAIADALAQAFPSDREEPGDGER